MGTWEWRSAWPDARRASLFVPVQLRVCVRACTTCSAFLFPFFFYLLFVLKRKGQNKACSAHLHFFYSVYTILCLVGWLGRPLLPCTTLLLALPDDSCRCRCVSRCAAAACTCLRASSAMVVGCVPVKCECHGDGRKCPINYQEYSSRRELLGFLPPCCRRCRDNKGRGRLLGRVSQSTN